MYYSFHAIFSNFLKLGIFFIKIFISGELKKANQIKLNWKICRNNMFYFLSYTFFYRILVKDQLPFASPQSCCLDMMNYFNTQLILMLLILPLLILYGLIFTFSCSIKLCFAKWYKYFMVLFDLIWGKFVLFFLGLYVHMMNKTFK